MIQRIARTLSHLRLGFGGKNDTLPSLFVVVRSMPCCCTGSVDKPILVIATVHVMYRILGSIDIIT